MSKSIYLSAFFCIGIIFQLSAQQINLTYSSAEVINQKIYRTITFDHNQNQKSITALKKNEISLLDYIGENTYIASIPFDISNDALSSFGISYVESNNIDRISSEVRNNALPEWAISDRNALLSLRYYEDIDQSYVLSQLEKHSIKAIAFNGINNIIEISTNLDKIDQLFTLPFLAGLEPISPPSIKDDKQGGNLHRANTLNPIGVMGRNYTGEGVTVLVRDDGALFPHIDYTGRIDQRSVGASRGDHGDGVAGIMVGAGNLDPDARGMAFGSDFFVTDYEQSFLDETMDLHRNQGVVITNSSYSNGCNGGYTNITRTVDQQSFQNPTLLHVFSAGNAGADDCGYGAGETWGNITGGHKIGKNVIATANLDNLGNLVASSSRGPSADGRIKPDIAANGAGHISAIEENGYEPFGGTSGAAPVVAGVSAMLYDAYNQMNGELPEGALIKAILLNSANDLGNKGPDYKHGWGALNAHRAASTLEENRYLKSTIDQDGFNQHTITIPDNVAEVKIMTYWSDRHGITSVGNSLINNINTSLSDGAEEYLPWVLDPTPNPVTLDMPATKGIEDRNNMEQISIDTPIAGDYTLSVNGNNIPMGEVEYYVIWEFITKEIDLTYPLGNENFIQREREVLFWDASGKEGEFVITLYNKSGDTLSNGTIDGARRSFGLTPPNAFNDSAYVEIRRGDEISRSESIIISPSIRAVEVNKTNNGSELSWLGFDDAISYNVHILGEKYMDIVNVTDTTSWIIPSEYKIGWIAVSPNFADGRQGKRTVAIPLRAAPEALIANDKDSKPCIDEVVVFNTPSADTLTSYTWNFGNHATPAEATTAGPHEVTYSRRGRKTGYFIIEHEGGRSSVFFEINVKRDPEGSKMNIDGLGFGEYNFSTDFKYLDSIEWDFGDGNTDKGEEVNYAYGTDGTYTVTVTGKSSCGDIIIMESIEVNTSTNTDDLLSNALVVKPNPNDGNFIVTLDDVKEVGTLRLINANGQIVNVKALSPDMQSINYSDIPNGFYLLQVVTQKGTGVKKIIIQ